MVFFISLILVLWALLSVYSIALTIEAFKKSLEPPVEKIDRREKKRIDESIDLLNKSPSIKEIVSEIIGLEKFPNSEACSMRAAILRTKLKLHVRNPVTRRALFDAINFKKK